MLIIIGFLKFSLDFAFYILVKLKYILTSAKLHKSQPNRFCWLVFEVNFKFRLVSDSVCGINYFF